MRRAEPQEELNHRRRAHEPPGEQRKRDEPGSWLSALYNSGLRPSPHPVFGSTFLRGFSRSPSKRGVPPLQPPHALHPPIGSELPRPFQSHQPRRKRREKPTGFVGDLLLHVLYARVLGPFHRRGKGHSVVRGGWRSQAGVVAKMAKWSWRCCGDCSVVA